MNFKDFLNKREIDKDFIYEDEDIDNKISIDLKKVTDVAINIAKKIYGDDIDSDKIDGMVKKAIDIADTTEEAIGIIKSFLKENFNSKQSYIEPVKYNKTIKTPRHASTILEGMDEAESIPVSIDEISFNQRHGETANHANDLL